MMNDEVMDEDGVTIMADTNDIVMTEVDIMMNSLGVQSGSLVGISDRVVTDAEAEVKSLGVQVGVLEGGSGFVCRSSTLLSLVRSKK